MSKNIKLSKIPSFNLDRLNKAIEAEKTKYSSSTDDDLFWKLEVDKSGNGVAVIRFLPPSEEDGPNALPWVRYWDHGFKGPTGVWYIENSLTTFDQKDPVSDYNSKLWNSTQDDSSPLRKEVRDHKRRLHYVSPILVVNDQKHPENNGKVFLFKHGKKIHDKITLAGNPTFEGDKPVNPFDMGPGGSNFRLKRRNVSGYPNYDESTWESPSAVSDDEEEIARIYSQVPALKDIVSPSKFKTYNELLERLSATLGLSTSHILGVISGEIDPNAPTRTVAKTVKKETKTFVEEDTDVDVDDPPFNVDDDDEDLKAFKSLV